MWELLIWSWVDQICIKSKFLVPWDIVAFMSKEVSGRKYLCQCVDMGGPSPEFLCIIYMCSEGLCGLDTTPYPSGNPWTGPATLLQYP